MTTYELQGKVAFVTGGGSGIGAAVSRLLAHGGAAVAVADIAIDAAEAVAQDIERTGGTAIALLLDVADSGAVDKAVGDVVHALGTLDIGVNSAGITGTGGLAGEYDDESWRQVMSVDLDGLFYCQRAEIRAMTASGAGGSIVNLASVLGQVGVARWPAYVAAKHAVVGLTRSAAIGHAPDQIRVNAVGPGNIETAMLSVVPAERLAVVRSENPSGRLGRAEEVAELVAWLASDAASYATGGFFPIDGGYLAV